ncbi:MAG: hypothetical protein C0624_05545 [Desulfuromonas sp.]|nr:MAG: hypothetical protein C0624_05545 [Desulfuromonas sp.]
MAGSAAAGAQTMTIGAATASSEAAGAAAGAGTTAVTALAGGAGTAATQGATAASNYRSQMATASGGAHAPETQTVLAAVVAPMTASSAEMQSAETLASPMSTSSATMGQDAESLTATTHTSGPIPVAGQTMKTTVYRKYRLPEFTFELGLWDLSDDGRRALSMVMDRLRKLDKWFIVRIDGHTDSTGPASYNETLAMRRAISVASHLVSNEGLNPEVVFLKGFGERKPYESNATMEGRQLNRRIELLVLVPEEN